LPFRLNKKIPKKIHWFTVADSKEGYLFVAKSGHLAKKKEKEGLRLVTKGFLRIKWPQSSHISRKKES
jgi:hypothetical protein